MADDSAVAWAAATNVVNGFEGATADQQGSAGVQLRRIEPFLDSADETPRAAFVDAVQQALNAREWFASDEDARAQASLFSAVRLVADRRELKELDKLLLADAQRTPPTGYDPASFGRLRLVARELPETCQDTLLETIEAPDWSDPPRAAAVLRLRTELAGGGAHLHAQHRRPARQHQNLPDAVATLVSWLESNPTLATATSFVKMGLQAPALLSALESWAAGRKESERTKLVLELLTVNSFRGPSLAAVAKAGVDEAAVVTRGDNRIRNLETLGDRKAVAQTLASIAITEPGPRSRLVKLMVWLLGAKRGKGNRDVFALVLGALAPGPLSDADAKKLRKAITAACKRKNGKKWRISESQGTRLVALDVELKRDWFGKGNARKFFDRIRGAEEEEEESSDEVPSVEEPASQDLARAG